MMPMVRAVLPALGLLAIGVLSGCGSVPQEKQQTETETATDGAAAPEVLGASSISEVFEKIGCKENDPLGTGGRIGEPGDFGYSPEMVKNGTCTPVEGGELIFFYEYGSPEDAKVASLNGSIEAYPGELFIDGSVLMLASDPAEQAVVRIVADPVN